MFIHIPLIFWFVNIFSLFFVLSVVVYKNISGFLYISNKIIRFTYFYIICVHSRTLLSAFYCACGHTFDKILLEAQE